LFLPAQDANEHARIVHFLGVDDVPTMNGVAFGGGQPALGVDLRQLRQFAQGNVDDTCAGLAQRGQSRFESACDGRLDILEHHGLRHRHPQPCEREWRKINYGLAGQDGVERRAACHGRRERADRIERCG
jgi:hypothetical protein